LVERERMKQDFFHCKLKPYEHYIPVSKNLSDLMDQLEWADNNYDKAQKIAQNARDFAVNHLNKQQAIKYLTHQLNAYLF
jgi:hypothetical protein